METPVPRLGRCTVAPVRVPRGRVISDSDSRIRIASRKVGRDTLKGEFLQNWDRLVPLVRDNEVFLGHPKG